MNFYKFFVRPFLFCFYPETAHYISLRALKFAHALPGLFTRLEKSFTFESSRLEQKIAGIHFKNPVGLAAGFDKTGELYPYFSRLGFGFIESGTVTGEGQPGNPLPRVFRYTADGALVNRMGFNNPGAIVVHQILAKQEKFIPRGVNAGKTKVIPLDQAVEDYLKTFQLLAPYADYYVINISSPNTPGLRDLQNRENFIHLLDGIQRGLINNPIPLFVKFAPDLADEDLLGLLDVCLDKKIKGIILTNTTLNKTNVREARNQEGGLSGRPLRSRSTEMIALAYQHLQGQIPIIGVGGIDSGESALEKIRAGASLIQIYTGYIYEGPTLPKRINEYLDDYMLKNGIQRLSDLVGN